MLYTPAPAKLSDKKRWYIEFYQYDPKIKDLVRIREYRNLNRITDLNERRKKAMYYIHELNTKLIPFGYPFVEQAKLPAFITIKEAVTLSFKIKCNTDRKKTAQTYGSVVNYFLDYIAKTYLDTLKLSDFTYIEAMAFMDHVVAEKNVKPRTYNNYKQYMTSIWSELIERSYINENPWSRVKKKKVTEKNRKMISDQDAQIILEEIHNTNQYLYLSILLLYYCFIRPGEQRRMKVHMIDLKNGTIYIPGEISKNKRSETVTIPRAILPIFHKIGIDTWHQNDYIFGQYMKPHPTIPCGTNTLNFSHKAVIQRLFRMKKLRSIDGISIYSWKDTGAMHFIKSGIDAYEVMRQMRHTDLSTTQKYLQSLSSINTNIRDLNISVQL